MDNLLLDLMQYHQDVLVELLNNSVTIYSTKVECVKGFFKINKLDEFSSKLQEATSYTINQTN